MNRRFNAGDRERKKKLKNRDKMKNIKLFENSSDYLDSEKVLGFITSITPGVGYIRDRELVCYNPASPIFYMPKSITAADGETMAEEVESFNAMKPTGDIFLFKPRAISDMWTGGFDFNIYGYVTEEINEVEEGGSAYTMTVKKEFLVALTDYHCESELKTKNPTVFDFTPGLTFECYVFDNGDGCGWRVYFDSNTSLNFEQTDGYISIMWSGAK